MKPLEETKPSAATTDGKTMQSVATTNDNTELLSATSTKKTESVAKSMIKKLRVSVNSEKTKKRPEKAWEDWSTRCTESIKPSRAEQQAEALAAVAERARAEALSQTLASVPPWW